MRFTNYDISHIDLIERKLEYDNLFELKAETFTDYEFGEKARTYMDDGRIIFSCGIKKMREGVGHCWVVPSIYIDDHKHFFAKEMKNILFENALQMKMHRIQTTIQEPLVKWIELLDFKRESVLHQIRSDKTDEYLYVKFF